ncbi:MAG: hypothetical protein K6D95_01055 [Treponema sp.]|nr:hypothetical protein [Treponema sp.]
MKMTKKILFGAAALCAAVLFSGCDWSLTSALQKTIGEDIFKYNDSTYDSGLGTWTVDNETNETEDYIRGGKLLLTKHSDIAGLVKINNGYADGEAVGNLGLLFNVSQNKGKDDEGNKLDNYDTWNFCVIGIQAYTATSVRYYVSYFANIVEEDMVKDNFGVSVTKNAVDTSVLTPYEIELQTWTTISNLASDGTFSIVFDVDEASDGSYTVQPYKANTVSDTDVFTADEDYEIGTTLTIPAATLGKSSAAQAYVGCYGMIKAGQTLDGSIKVLDLTKQAILLAE